VGGDGDEGPVIAPRAAIVRPEVATLSLFRRPASLTGDATWRALATPPVERSADEPSPDEPSPDEPSHSEPSPDEPSHSEPSPDEPSHGEPSHDETIPGFDPSTLGDLPTPAARWLRHALPEGTALTRVVEVEMAGRIRLGPRWFPVTAEQILRAGVGFVWRPIVGGRILRFEGVDELGPDGARTEFRLHGRIPVVRVTGDDVARSAAGRLAAETVSWLPQAVAPQSGAGWTEVDDDRARVAVDTPAGPIDVQITVADDGRLTELVLQRWNDSVDPAREEAFGGDVQAEHVTDQGVRLAGSGTVGWGRGTTEQPDREFFRYRITAVRPPR
jgi:hypothetical protein